MMSPLFDLTGKTALITGSTKGIGKAIAEHMAQSGAHVVISSRKEDACREVASQIQQQGGLATPIPANISHKAFAKSVFTTAGAIPFTRMLSLP